MDTPAITPEILASSSSSSSTKPSESAAPAQSQAHLHLHSHSHILPQTQLQPQKQATTTTMDSYFFANALRPLSPPESPFAFDAAFSAKPTSLPTSTAPASPHFDLPALVRPTAMAAAAAAAARLPTPKSSKTKRERGWAKAVLKSTAGAENPYFPSIAEQERAERWARDAARLPQASPPVDTVGGAGPLDPLSHANVAGPSASSPSTADEAEHGGGFKLHLSDVRRRRALALCTSGGAQVPASPESMASGRSREGEEAYRRGMAAHVAERIKRRNVRPEPWGRDGFEW
ncbi:hypothetical protein P171DRAFT_30040 [Karstenula rhodostoma CBS 690.94]|uniref:Uncharacterized protein n=1 Tax=Karstenula rhodostoma CBS 690.94 TaxID=1392251 RepID=A0A9P4PHS9_9PLEO|nr:hypothetical protein P171DRAFT_30040 [Karstenula rhodostoma CBS 690.94]